MGQRKTHKKNLGFQEISEVLIQHIDELKLLENRAIQTIENALHQIEEQQNKKIQIDPTNYIRVANEFLTKFQEPQKTYMLLIKETMQKVAEEQNKINIRTQELNSELYKIQAEVKKLSKVGFNRLPNYLVATLIGIMGLIVLILLIL